MKTCIERVAEILDKIDTNVKFKSIINLVYLSFAVMTNFVEHILY